MSTSFSETGPILSAMPPPALSGTDVRKESIHVLHFQRQVMLSPAFAHYLCHWDLHRLLFWWLHLRWQLVTFYWSRIGVSYSDSLWRPWCKHSSSLSMPASVPLAAVSGDILPSHTLHMYGCSGRAPFIRWCSFRVARSLGVAWSARVYESISS